MSETMTATPKREDAQACLVEIWQRKLRVSSVAADDNFFDLGGDSVLAVDMLLEVQREFDKDPPLSLLSSGLTVARLVAWLETGDPVSADTAVAEDDGEAAPAISSVLVPLRDSGTKQPVFLVHGVGLPGLRGTFIENLDPAQPAYIFQHRGLDGETVPNETIEEMAADYIAAMREVQPTGPYLIGGFCAGAIVALEMAHQLTHRGEPVPMVYMVDPPRILHAHVGRGAVLWYAKRGSAFLRRKVGRAFDRGHRKSMDVWREKSLERRSQSPAFPSSDQQPTHEGVRRAQESFMRALRRYRPNSYPGIIHFIRPRDHEQSRRTVEEFWLKAYDDVRVEEMAQSHDTIYKEEFPRLARHLQRCLDEIET